LLHEASFECWWHLLIGWQGVLALTSSVGVSHRSTIMTPTIKQWLTALGIWTVQLQFSTM